MNTNWDLFLHDPTKVYYLRNNDHWLQTSDLKGAWTPAAQLPGSFGKLPVDENWKEVKAALPGKNVTAAQVPKVFLSQTPAELMP